MNLILEFCQNHNGDKGLLWEMLSAASETGAQCVKIQNIYAKKLAFRPEFERENLGIDGKLYNYKRPYNDEFNRLRGLELDDDTIIEFVERAKKLGLTPMTTCFTLDNVEDCKRLGFESIKVASYDCGSVPLLEALRDNFKQVYVSTGASYTSEIRRAFDLMPQETCSFLHCVTIYPTPIELANFGKIDWLRLNWSGRVGYSDHSAPENDGLLASKIALFKQVDCLERHFTILNKDDTKDGVVSINSKQAGELLEFASLAQCDQIKVLRESEREIEKFLNAEVSLDLSHAEVMNRRYYRGRFTNHIETEEGSIYTRFNYEAF